MIIAVQKANIKKAPAGSTHGAFFVLADRTDIQILVTKGDAMCNVFDLIAVQANVGQFALIKFGKGVLGLVLNTQGTQVSENFCEDHFITYIKPSDSVGNFIHGTGM